MPRGYNLQIKQVLFTYQIWENLPLLTCGGRICGRNLDLHVWWQTMETLEYSNKGFRWCVRICVICRQKTGSNEQSGPHKEHQSYMEKWDYIENTGPPWFYKQITKRENSCEDHTQFFMYSFRSSNIIYIPAMNTDNIIILMPHYL